MARVIRTFTLESELSNTLDSLVKSGTSSPLLLYLFKKKVSASLPVKLPSLTSFDESGLCAADYKRFYAMLQVSSSTEPSMSALLTAINMYGQAQTAQITAAFNKAVLENTKIRRAEERAHQKATALAERTNRKKTSSDIRNYRNVSRIAEALINTGLEALERKVAALDTPGSAKSDAGQSGHK